MFRVFDFQEKKTQIYPNLLYVGFESFKKLGPNCLVRGRKTELPKKKETPQTQMGPTLSFKHWIQVMKGLKSVQSETFFCLGHKIVIVFPNTLTISNLARYLIRNAVNSNSLIISKASNLHGIFLLRFRCDFTSGTRKKIAVPCNVFQRGLDFLCCWGDDRNHS